MFLRHTILTISLLALACSSAAQPLYNPPVTYPVSPTVLMQIAYTQPVTGFRSIQIALREPVGKAGRLPVVIWSHGGDGQANAENALPEWSRLTASAGYLTVTPAHRGRDASEFAAYCVGLNLSPAECAVSLGPANWDRPNDIIAVMNELERMNSTGPLAGRIALDKIAVGGWSAGSAGAMSVAGASRFFTATQPRSFMDPRPAAFLALSPSSPGRLGFFETSHKQPNTSWDQIHRPLFAASGEGDTKKCEGLSACEETPTRRRIAFDRLPAGSKYLFYINDTDTRHGTFSLDTGECLADGVVLPVKCAAFSAWLASTALAFLDAHVEHRPLAIAWLAGPLAGLSSGGAVEWVKK